MAPATIENRLRAGIAKVIPCDVLDPKNIVPDLEERPVDAVVSTLCLQAACQSVGEYRKAVKSLASLLKPGGFMIISAFFNSTYVVGEKWFIDLELTKPQIEDAFEAAGIQIQQFIERDEEFTEGDGSLKPSDYKNAFAFLGFKK